MASDKSNSIWFELVGSTSHESFMSPTCSPLHFINYSKSGGNIIDCERGNLLFSDGFLIFIFAVSKLQHAWENPSYTLLLLTLVHGFFMFLLSPRVCCWLWFMIFLCSFFLSKGYLIFIFAVSKLQLTWENPRYMLLLLTLVHGFFYVPFFPKGFSDIYFRSFKFAAYRRNFEVHW